MSSEPRRNASQARPHLSTQLVSRSRPHPAVYAAPVSARQEGASRGRRHTVSQSPDRRLWSW